MYASIFTDELRIEDIAKTLDVLRAWGLEWVDLRNGFFGKPFFRLAPDELARLRCLLREHGLRVACLESALAKCHLPDAERRAREAEDLEGVIRAADALECRLVRSFFYWQPHKTAADEAGRLHERPDRLEQALSFFAPLAARARAAGLTLAFENCGVATWEVKAFLEKLGVAEWGMAWDVANGWYSEQELRKRDEADYLRGNARLTRVVHVKARGVVPGLETEPVPYARILPVLAKTGFVGAVSVETHAQPGEAMSRQVLDAIRASLPR